MHIKTQIAGKIMNEINDYLERKDSLDNILNLSQESTEKECLSVNKVENSEGYMTLLSEGSVLYQDAADFPAVHIDVVGPFYPCAESELGQKADDTRRCCCAD